MTAPIDLSTVRPDYNELLARFAADLGRLDSWKDHLPGSVGRATLGFLSACTTQEVHAIQSYFLENFPDTANNDSSQFKIARMLGVRLTRKLSPSITVQIQRLSTGSPQVIPKWTSFSANSGQGLVTMEPIVFDVGQGLAQATLYLGTVKEQAYQSDGSDFQTYVVDPAGAFYTSDIHVEVRVNEVPWRIVTNGLWNYGAGAQVVVDSTLGTGQAVFQFGTNQFGGSPNAGDFIRIKALETQGADTKNLSMTQSITAPTGFTCKALFGMTSGGNENPSTLYKVMAGHNFTANEQASTAPQYTATALSYPGVVDAKILCQRDIDPYDLRLMNVIRMVLLLENGTFWTRELDTPGTGTYLQLDTDGGRLAPGTFSYRISAVNEIGETLASPATTFILTVPGSILIRWYGVPNATKYNIYGRIAGSEQYIGQVQALTPPTAVHTYVDRGIIVPNGALPALNSTRADWWKFKEWFEKYQHSTVQLVQQSPVPVKVGIQIIVYAFTHVTSLDNLRLDVYSAIAELFKPRLGTLGRLITRSDITNAARVPDPRDSTRTLVDYVDLVFPTKDLDPGGPGSFLYIDFINVATVFTKRLEGGK